MSARTLQSQKHRQKRKRRLEVKIVFGVVAFLLIIVGSICVLRLSYLQIQEVIVRGEHENLNEIVSEEVREVLSGAYVYVIPRKNTFLFSKKDIQKMMRDEFPQIRSYTVSLNRFGDRVLYLDIEKREEAGVWCREECYYIDSRGYVYEKSPTYSTGIITEYRGIIEGFPIGRTYLNPEIFSGVNVFIDVVNKTVDGIHIVGLRADNEMDFTFFLKRGGELYVDASIGFERVLENIGILFEQQSFNDDMKEGNVEYIDARLPGKIFYKTKSEV